MMKKILAIMLVFVMVLAMAACGAPKTPAAPAATEAPAPVEEPAEETVPVMSHAEYVAAELEEKVVIDTFVQAHQSWWDNKITVYAASEDGAYFIYNMACSEEDEAKLVPGTEILVTGYKSEWAGEVEITDATFEILDGSYIATAKDVTKLLGKEELIEHQNELVSFSALTVESIEYKNGEPGDDIYVAFNVGGKVYNFCVEAYLTGPDTAVYAAVGELKPGDVVDVEGFLYWYEGVNTHITAVKPAVAALKAESVMSYDEYAAAELDEPVTVECYVQDHQSWWDNQVTVYAQDPDGAYFIYNMACAKEDEAKLVPGTKIKVTGYKTEWSGEVEIADATFEFEDGCYIAAPTDVTSLLGTDELIVHQNKFVTFKGLTVEKIEYKNGEPGDDIYVTVSLDGKSYDFCVEFYLRGTDTEVYKAVGELQTGDVIDVEGFLYWYNGVNTHITAVSMAE